VQTDGPPDIVVVAGGAPVSALALTSVDERTRVVGADAGVAFAVARGWSVDVAVGDFDSLAPHVVEHLHDIASEVRRYPCDKAATDLELALDVALESAPARVLVIGIEGGRPDHALANLLVASSGRLSPLAIEISLEGARAWVVHDRLEGSLPEGALLSVVPVHGPATVSLAGMRWPLDHHDLVAGSTRGISNEATGGPFSLTVHAGTVLCIAPRPEENPR
jgi:thiamine pyrophosphokinase